jgi:predicted glycosyltransferase/predicted transcriptional regulator
MRPNLSQKIWIAMGTPFQVNFFYPLIEKLKKKFDFLITARNHDRIFSMLDSLDLDYVPVGKHGGTKREGKLEAYAENILQLMPIIEKEKPDLLLTERWPEAVRVAFGLNIPAWSIFYDEREYHVNRMVFPLSSKVFTPSFYNMTELRSNGVDPKTIVWFRGFHTCYLKEQKMVNRKNPFQEMGYKPPIILVRPEPELASFFGHKERVLEKTVSLLSDKEKVKEDFSILVLPRTESQAQTYQKYPIALIDDALAENPVNYADVTLGAAETMLMESFVLGKPAISTVYWQESKPLAELHKYIAHTTDPKEAATHVLNYLDSKRREDFRLNAEKVVNLMDNPVAKMEEEINKFWGETVEKRFPSKRRSAIEIYANILRIVAFRSLKITRIMQEANLAYSKVKSYVAWLKKRGLIGEQIDLNGEVYYRTTPEGLSILNDYERIAEKLF